MAQAILLPGAVGFRTDMFVGSVADVNPGLSLAHDDDASGISYSGGGGTILNSFVVLGSSLPPRVRTVNSISVYNRWKQATTDTFEPHHVNPGIRFGGAETYGSAQATSVGSYADFVSASLARPGGGAWTRDDLAAIEFIARVDANSPGGATHRCTSVWAVLDYSPCAGGFVAIVG